MASAPAPPQEHAPVPPEQRFVLGATDWQTYQAISNALKGRHVRLTYDRGNLELRTISGKHGNCSRLLGRFVFVLAEEFNLTVRSFGDMTCDSEELDRGVEPDESFYLTNEPRVRDKEEINIGVDPPPDLMVEIDIRRSSKTRMSIYAAMRVPEVWQFDGQNIYVWHLRPGGQYVLSSTSQYFPSLPVQEIATFLQQRLQTDEVSLVGSFRAWVREQIAKRSSA
jgi:Uma2 family endonuclease